MSEIKMLPPPDLYMGTKLAPYEERTFRVAAHRENLGYTSDPKEFYSAETVQKIVAARDAEIKTLRAIIDNREAIIATRAADTREYQKQLMHAQAHAERLAEAVQEVVDDIAEWGEPAKGAHVERIHQQLKTVLRDGHYRMPKAATFTAQSRGDHD